jgi:hypothetical protein
MANSERGQQKPASMPEIELHPDAWERFGDFVKRIAKAGPQHRTKKEGASNPRRKPKPRQKP